MKLFYIKFQALFFILFVALSSPLSTHAQNYAWAKSLYSSNSLNISSIAIDGSGNVYTTGLFNGTADFDPSANTANLTATGQYDIFICKFDASGDYVWAKSMGGPTLFDYGGGTDIFVDGSGNVYTTGYFNGTVDFDPSANTANLTATTSDIFVCKFTSAGSYVWAKNMGGTGSGVYSKAIIVDGSGNVYTTGSFNATVDFDPSANTANLTSVGYDDIFVSKLNASGNYVWAKSMGGTFKEPYTYQNDRGGDIAVDGSGNVFVSGVFTGTADFDPSANTVELTATGTSDCFVSKFDAAGNYVWAKSMGITADDSYYIYESPYAIALDGSGDILLTGYFAGTQDFDPSANTANLVAAGGDYAYDMFVCKFTSAGNYVWAKSMGGTSVEDISTAIALDASGNIYTTGYFEGTADFDPSANTANLTAAGYVDFFVSKLDASGNYVWAKSVGSTGLERGLAIAVDGSGNNIYTTGIFNGTADFDPSANTAELTAVGYNNAFVSKLSSAVLPVELLSFSGKHTEGGNLLTWQTASELNNKGFEIERLNTSGNWENIGFKTTNNKASIYQFTDNNPFTTSYYRLRQLDFDGTETVSKVISVELKGKGKGLTIYPTLVSNVLTVDYTEGSLFQVTNLLGQQVLSGKTTQQIDVSRLSQGTYVLKVGTEVAKFVKQ